MHRYKTWNGAMPTTAAQASVTTGTSIKTMLQLATPSTRQIQLISWGFSVDDPPGADGVVELLQGDVAATVTAHVAAGVQPLDPNAPASLLTLGTSATGYTATAEGTITASRVFDVVSLSSTTAESPLTYTYQWMPDERPIIAVSKFLRVRATTPTTAADLRCWICWDE
ncbi:hypothetical protein I5Q34_33155 [Streptomyces sp. AV19]|uniref:hypothetical protein n=1 Tax=Streptomyces sp. AV19 TaxID=2793068 RepID=UPI0018FEAB38|nr:hypothetical protein [Streptomyces sp. AV19]MBH1939052.1 hypothetical protein [Streptomyces sp. AV19]MDG4531602.1 hypothetical protein [Streptomyces sp. AV19]